MSAVSRFLPNRRPRWGTLALVALFHLVVITGLVRVFAPDLAVQAMRQAASIFVTVTTREEAVPTSTPRPKRDVGGSAPPAKKAKPLPISAPKQAIPVEPPEAAAVASTGNEIRTGASAAGAGTGGGGEGRGTGSGNSGAGQGNGAVTKPVLISGAINGAKDFPIPPGGREARIGRSLIVALTVGTDGVPGACRIYRSSGLPETDRRTCDLAMERLRFRPATNADGEPVVGTFYWQQRFFD